MMIDLSENSEITGTFLKIFADYRINDGHFCLIIYFNELHLTELTISTDFTQR